MFCKIVPIFAVFVLFSATSTTVHGQILFTCDEVEKMIVSEVLSLLKLQNDVTTALNATLQQTLETAVNVALQQKQQIQNVCPGQPGVDVQACIESNAQCITATSQSVSNSCLSKITDAITDVLIPIYDLGKTIKAACCSNSTSAFDALQCPTGARKFASASLLAATSITAVATDGTACAANYGTELTKHLGTCATQSTGCATTAGCVLDGGSGGGGGLLGKITSIIKLDDLLLWKR